ncbi:hypothetical protein OHA79_25030 [Streptomyces sp. NBC_00841]|uniref:hypothetical protein n=1 Tax=unclassified Streptomyces TaxID=2593676 RepID=UPI00224FDF99|nr:MULTISPECIES: hypothetical protein [unclassified Streptomyces]MCX4533792.1 hypothetical protein [Streptomyces sp. NBC_01669]WSA00815.1 hypothetical protein OHA79_25030 [Streptomyces sp. NBC_00841]
MSRTQWCCLVAVLAVVLGLFCGPATAGAAATASGDSGTAVAAPAVDGQGVPGCGNGTKHDGTEPGVPVRARAAHDQAPGLAEWGLSAAPWQGSAEPCTCVRLRGPECAAPSWVELSVLRV